MQFRTPGTIIIEPGGASDPETFRPLSEKGLTLLVTDANLVKLGLAAEVQSALEKAGCEVLVSDQVEPEPTAATVRKIAEVARSMGARQVVGLGGGSPMDVAKLVALLAPYPQEMKDIYGVDRAQGSRLPLTLIPTTAGTGSEGTPVAVVTGDDGEKSPVLGPQFICDRVILDAALTLDLPSKVTADTGVDAMVHAIEAYTSSVRKNPISDQLAVNALRLLYGNIRTAVSTGQDLEARGNMLVGSMLAGVAFANASVGAVHALAYPLGTRFHMSHGASNALVLTPVMRFNLPVSGGLYGALGKAILPECSELSDSCAAQRLIDSLSALIPELGLQDRLSQCGIGEDDLGDLVEGTLRQERIMSYNIRPMTGEDIYDTFKSVL